MDKPLPSSSHSPIHAALFNARSVNKALLLADLISNKNLDFLFLTEMWHKEDEFEFGTLNLPRSSGRGGGIISVYNWPFLNIQHLSAWS